MKIDIQLFSEESIQDAIRQLMVAQNNLRWGVNETVDILTKEGADVAQDADGEMAVVVGYMADENVGIIDAVGDAPVIAEFGAGDATIEDTRSYFENRPDTEVFKGSYSLLVGSGEYYLTGRWHFGGVPFVAIPPRQGLYKAKQHIMDEAVNVAKEVIKL